MTASDPQGERGGNSEAANGSLGPILAMTFVYFLGRSMSLPLIPSFYELSKLSVADIGITLGTFAVAFLVSEAGWGFLSDRLRHRSSIFLLIGASSLTSLVFTRPQPLWVLIVVQLFSALCLGGIGLFPRLTISGLADARLRGSSFGYLGLVFAVGPMAGALLGALLSGWVGMADTFVAVTVVSLMALIPLRFVVFPTRGAVLVVPREALGAPPPPPTSQRLGGLQLLVIGAVGLTYSSTTSFYSLLFPNILTQDPTYHASVLQVAIVISVFSLSSGVLQPLMVSLCAKNPRRWIIAGLMGSGATFFLLLGYSAFIDVYAIAFAAGASVAVTAPLALLVLSSGVREARLGRALGLFGAAEDFGIMVGGSIGTFVWALSGPGAAFAGVGAQCIAVGGAAALTLRGGTRSSRA
jgi:MFS family permease